MIFNDNHIVKSRKMTKPARTKASSWIPRGLKKPVFLFLVPALSLCIFLNPISVRPAQGHIIEALVIGYLGGIAYGTYSLGKFIYNKITDSWPTDLSISFGCPEGLEVVSDFGSGTVPMEMKNLYTESAYFLDFYTSEDGRFSGVIVIQKPPTRPELAFDICISPALFQSARLIGSAKIQARNELSEDIFSLTIYPEDYEK